MDLGFILYKLVNYLLKYILSYDNLIQWLCIFILNLNFINISKNNLTEKNMADNGVSQGSTPGPLLMTFNVHLFSVISHSEA